jgi:hypothetical protein
MMLINMETFEKAREKLVDPATRADGINELKKMMEIKQAHLWRSDAIAPCCGNLGGFACQLNDEVNLFEQVIPMLEKGDLKAARPILDRLYQSISYGMGQKETPDLIERLTAQPKKA